jgi:hypothetical protein
MNKLAVVAIGWHYPIYFYEQMVKQKIPANWDVDFFVVGHRDPKYAENEKIVDKNTDDLLKSLDYIMYVEPVTKNHLKNIGWEYINGKQGNEWEGANLWLDNYNYKDYDCLLFMGDDAFLVSNDLFENVLGGEVPNLFKNVNINEKWVLEIDYKTDDWLVLCNGVIPGRAVMRGSCEFYKSEILDMMGGKFEIDDQIQNLSKKLEGNTKTKEYYELTEYNTQCFPFTSWLIKNDLYKNLKFLSPFYRVSNHIIECERGLISNNMCLPFRLSYLEGIELLKKFNRI